MENPAVAGNGGGRPSSGCGWIDGQDNSAAPDTGRGLTDWKAHYAHVMNYNGWDTADELVSNRLAILSRCLSRQAYANAYAGASVAIAAAGRKDAGWINGMDSRAGNDPGRGLSDRGAHYDHIASGRGLTTAHILVRDRMRTLRAALSRDAYARLYADLSVLIARCGVNGQCE